jgi:hypothetical protein
MSLAVLHLSELNTYTQIGVSDVTLTGLIAQEDFNSFVWSEISTAVVMKSSLCLVEYNAFLIQRNYTKVSEKNIAYIFGVEG